MLQKSKAQNAKNRRKKNQDSEEINDMDNKISMIISEMKNVAAVSGQQFLIKWNKFQI